MYTKTELIKKAIFIGINEYEDKKIPILAGAENDAVEICERFVKNGDFNILDNHKLIGSDATRKNILSAVSDIFRSDEKCDLITFYFSGHGVLDNNKEGYIAPYDMVSSDPFINGINMDDLRKVISNSKNDAGVITFLDCCYAGIVTKDLTKAIASTAFVDTTTKDLYSEQVIKIIGSTDTTDPKLQYGKGKIILASSESDSVSREKKQL